MDELARDLAKLARLVLQHRGTEIMRSAWGEAIVAFSDDVVIVTGSGSCEFESLEIGLRADPTLRADHVATFMGEKSSDLHQERARAVVERLRRLVPFEALAEEA